MTTRTVDTSLTPPDRAPSQLQRITDAFVLELRRAMGLPPTPAAHNLVRLFFGRPVGRVAAYAVGLEHAIEKGGLAAGARWVPPYLVAGHTARGLDLIPNEGPLLVVANHPGATDVGLITAYMQRPDYRIVVGSLPVYSHMPHFSRYAIWSPVLRDTFGRAVTVRQSIRHLKSGGALMICPRGGIEPDPALVPDPDVDFGKWSHSLEILLESVPGLQVLVSIVSGVIAPSATRHWLTRLRSGRAERQRLAFMVQFMRQAWTGHETFGLRPKLTFGELLTSATPAHILSEITGAARRTLQKNLIQSPA